MFWCDLPRDVVVVRGPDAASFLQSQTSQDLRPLAVGDSAWSFLLEPQGRIDVLLRVWRAAEDEYVLDTDAGFGEAMRARLQRFRIRVKADVEPVGWRCIAVRGEGAEGLAGLPAWGGGVDLLGPDPSPPVGARAGTAEDLLRARIDAVWPAMGTEILPGVTIPAETGIVPQAVSFTKGCYPGQELVERMDSRGATARRSLQRVRVAEHVGDCTSQSGEFGLAYVARGAS